MTNKPLEVSSASQPIPKATMRDVWEKAVPAQEAQGEFAFIRYLSVPISTVLINASVSPDGATMMLLFWGLVGVVLIATGNFWLILLGAVAMILHVIFDNVDGEIARYLKKTSWLGHFFELACHDFIHGLLFLSLGWAVYVAYDPNPIYLILSAVAGLFAAINRNLRGKVAWTAINDKTKSAEEQKLYISDVGKDALGGPKSFLAKVITNGRIIVFGYQQTIFFILPIAILIGRLDWFIIFYSFAIPLIYFLKVFAIYRSGRRDRPF